MRHTSGTSRASLTSRIRIRRTLIASVALGVALAGAPATAQAHGAPDTHAAHGTNAPVGVTLTVQGPDGPLFHGKVRTRGHDVTTATGGTHRCDGTNGGAHPSAVPTPTAALDDAARKRHFGWDGAWYASFDDYSVDSIKNVSGGGSAYWNISVNGTPTPVGGCQFELNAGDTVAFTWTAF
ncbi:MULTISPECIES: DUF4430 domain-containing protein [unclassified Streptomyces]|uniref:DUF4430 domain-containing protein n=1 Tax=unclassified Streptomyces TaxID=2593676 RepID=UPI00362B1E85